MIKSWIDQTRQLLEADELTCAQAVIDLVAHQLDELERLLPQAPHSITVNIKTLTIPDLVALVGR